MPTPSAPCSRVSRSERTLSRRTASSLVSGTTICSLPAFTQSGRSAMSPARSPRISASFSGDSSTSRQPRAVASSVHFRPAAVTGMTPTCISSVRESPATPSARQTCADPSVGWPAKAISYLGVKIRTAAFARVEGSRNVVSERLNCNASDCICCGSSDLPSSKTQSGLPLKRSSARVKTFTIRKLRVVMRLILKQE